MLKQWAWWNLGRQNNTVPKCQDHWPEFSGQGGNFVDPATSLGSLRVWSGCIDRSPHDLLGPSKAPGCELQTLSSLLTPCHSARVCESRFGQKETIEGLLSLSVIMAWLDHIYLIQDVCHPANGSTTFFQMMRVTPSWKTFRRESSRHFKMHVLVNGNIFMWTTNW